MRSRAIAASAAITLGLVMMGTSAYGAPDSLAGPAVEQSSSTESAQNAPEQKTETVASPAENAATNTTRKAETPADQGAGSAASSTPNPATQIAQAKAPANNEPATGKDTPAPAPSTTENQQSAPKTEGATAPSATENTVSASPAPAPSTPAPSAQTPSTPEDSTAPTAPEPAAPLESETATSASGADTDPAATNVSAEKETAATATEHSVANDRTGSIATNAKSLPAPQKSVEKAVEKIAGANSEVGALTTAQVKAVTAAACPTDAVCADASGVASIYTTVQDAITAAQGLGKSKVIILSGDYAPFTVAFAMQIMAAQGANVNILLPAGSAAAAITVDSDGVQITGVNIVCGQSAGFTRGIDIFNVNNVSINNVTTTNCQRGISLGDANSVNIANSTFNGYQNGTNSAAIWGDNVSAITVSNSTFTNQNTGTNFADFSNVTISGNTFATMGTASVFSNGVNGAFLSNTVTGTTGSGVYVTGTNGFTGSNNEFLNGLGNGFSFTNDTGANSGVILLDGNYFENMGGWAVNFAQGSLASDAQATVTNNDFSQTGKAISATGAGAQVIATGNNYFGVCGANAHDQAYNGGGATVEGAAGDIAVDRAGCETIPTPQVSAQAPICRADGSQTAGTYTLPASPGTVYVSNGAIIQPGTYPVSTNQTVYALSGRSMWYGPDIFAIQYIIPNVNIDCQGGGKGAATIPVKPQPVPNAPSMPEGTSPKSVANVTPPVTTSPGALAATGTQGMPALAMLAGALVLAGGALLISRRRTHQ